jgi:dimethylglycine dehydrogenase
VIGDFTLADLADGTYLLIGSGPAEAYHMRWFQEHLPSPAEVTIKPYGLGLTGLTIAGPRARELLASVTDEDDSTEAFRFMDIKRMEIGIIPCLVGRVSFTGDLGFEIWVAAEYQRALFLLLEAAGQEHGVKLFGTRAVNALRLESGYGTWAREYRPIYGALEAGLNRYVDLNTDEAFIGQKSAQEEAATGGRYRLRAFSVDCKTADPIGDEPIYLGGACCGWITSGAYSHTFGKSIGLGYVPAAHADVAGASWEVEVLGERLPAQLLSEPLFKSNAKRRP